MVWKVWEPLVWCGCEILGHRLLHIELKCTVCYYCILLLVGVLDPSNKRFAFARFGLRCFPSESEWILLLLFTLSSFPLTSSDRARPQLQLGYFYFCRFLLLWGGSNSNWTSTSGQARDGQVRARATDGERKSGRTRNNRRIKDSDFASMTRSSFLTSPVYMPPCSLCFLACPWVDILTDQWLWPMPGLGSLSSHWKKAVFLSVFWWADEESAAPHHRDEGAHFFHRFALDSLCFPSQNHKGPLP